MSAVDLRVSVGALELANPIMVASGTFGFGKEYTRLSPPMDVGRLGALVTKGLSLEPRKGNPAPRTAETAAGMLNAVGLENPGFEAFVRDKLPWLRSIDAKVIVNIFGAEVREYAELAGLLDTLDGVDALEVNISCPNVKKGGMAFGADAELAAEVASKVRQNTSKPVLVKLSPNVTDIVAIAERVARTGVDGLTLINTLKGMAIDPLSGRPLLGNVMGGLSGPAIRPVAVRMVYEVCQALEVPVVGCGGITVWQDAVEFMRAGACAVQVGSVTFRNPLASLEILDGLEGYLSAHRHSSPSDLVGTVVKSGEGS
jgi:dihydroorotate dehydrogenase (NAD+) catalytic subunit